MKTDAYAETNGIKYDKITETSKAKLNQVL
jgi:hypothetical protein